jgi:hypothetical protein
MHGAGQAGRWDAALHADPRHRVEQALTRHRCGTEVGDVAEEQLRLPLEAVAELQDIHAKPLCMSPAVSVQEGEQLLEVCELRP